MVVKKKKILPFVTAWMDLENIMLSGTSQSEKDKYHMISLYVESSEQTELTSKTETDSQIESRLTALGVGWLGGGGMGRKGIQL